MSAAELVEQFRKLTLKEQREAFERIREVVEDDVEDALTPEQLSELERRAEEFRKNPQAGIPWEKARQEAHKRFGWK